MIYKYFLEIISIGAAPYDNRVQWLEETRKVGSVIRMVLNPLADLFKPDKSNDVVIGSMF